jgi:ribosomal protein S18 acetylase RimI-like enzyme
MIRDAEARDEGDWRRLWADYLAFYKANLPPAVTDATWARIIDPESRMSCRLVEDRRAACWASPSGTIIMASWHVADDCYLEDLYVDPTARGQGLGRALMDDLFAIARQRGFGRIYWHTNTDNARARTLYDSYAPADGHIRYRLAL